MAKETTNQGRLGRVQRLLARLTSNRGELQHIEPSRMKLEELYQQLQEAADRQAFHTAGKQEASQQFQECLAETERLMTVLVLALKHHYGIRSERLSDFGVQPFRGRARKTDPIFERQPTARTPEPSAATGTVTTSARE